MEQRKHIQSSISQHGNKGGGKKKKTRQKYAKLILKIKGVSINISIYNKYKWVNFNQTLKRLTGLKTTYKLTLSKLQQQHKV